MLRGLRDANRDAAYAISRAPIDEGLTFSVMDWQLVIEKMKRRLEVIEGGWLMLLRSIVDV